MAGPPRPAAQRDSREINTTDRSTQGADADGALEERQGCGRTFFVSCGAWRNMYPTLHFSVWKSLVFMRVRSLGHRASPRRSMPKRTLACR